MLDKQMMVQPTAYAQGNQVYNNIMTDCGTMIVDGYSSFQATGQRICYSTIISSP